MNNTEIKESIYCKSLGQPLWQLAIFFILTLGLYQYYWFYKKLNYLKKHNNEEINPVLRVFLILLPIVDFFVCADIFKRIFSYLNKNSKKQTSILIGELLSFVLIFSSNSIFYSRVFNIHWLEYVSILSLIVILLTQHIINIKVKHSIL